MAVTVKDVAAVAKVSAATVSRVMNGDRRISEDTALRVRAAVAQLGYTVNQVARGLKTARSFSIGFICPEFTNNFYMSVAKGLDLALRESGYSLIMSASNEDLAEESDRIAVMLDKKVDGLVILPAGRSGAHFKTLSAAGVPLVLVDRHVDDLEADSVLVDNRQATRQAIEEMFGIGLRRIGFIGGNQNLSTASERYEGFLEAFARAGIASDDSLVRFGDYHDQSGYRLMAELMSLDTPPEAIFISNYFMHAGAMRYLIETGNPGAGNPGGRPVPFIAAFDELELSTALGFCKLFVRQPMELIGSTAAKLVLERVGQTTVETEGKTRNITVATELVHSR